MKYKLFSKAKYFGIGEFVIGLGPLSYSIFLHHGYNFCKCATSTSKENLYFPSPKRYKIHYYNDYYIHS